MVNLDENATTLEISLLNLDGSLAAIGEPDDEALRIAGEGQQSLFVTDLSFSPPLDLSRFLGILSATSVHTVAATAVQTPPVSSPPSRSRQEKATRRQPDSR